MASFTTLFALFVTTGLVMFFIFAVWLKWKKRFWNTIELVWIVLASFSMFIATEGVEKLVIHQNIEAKRSATKEKFDIFLDDIKTMNQEFPEFYDVPQIMSLGCGASLSILGNGHTYGVSLAHPDAMRERGWEVFAHLENESEIKRIIGDCRALLTHYNHPILGYELFRQADIEVQSLIKERGKPSSLPHIDMWPLVLAFAFGLRLSRALAAFRGLT